MRLRKRGRPEAAGILAAVAVAALLAPQVEGTTLMRVGLEELTAINSTIVIGEVLDSTSYWNDEGTFILTDVQVRLQEVLKGKEGREEVTVTLLGGTVGELSTLVLGTPVLEPERSYVLFLNEEDLPGVRDRLTVRDHCQGAFDLQAAGGELRARSQAVGFGLLPDAAGALAPPGGEEGLEIEAMIRTVRALAKGSSLGATP